MITERTAGKSLLRCPFYLNSLPVNARRIFYSAPKTTEKYKKRHRLLFSLNSSFFRCETSHAATVVQTSLPFFSFPLNVNFHLLLTFRRFSLPLLRHYVNALFTLNLYSLFFCKCKFCIITLMRFPGSEIRAFIRPGDRAHVRRNARENSGQPITGPITGDRRESDGRQKCSAQALFVSLIRIGGEQFFCRARANSSNLAINYAPCKMQGCNRIALFLSVLCVRARVCLCVCVCVCVCGFFFVDLFSHCRELCTRRFRIK